MKLTERNQTEIARRARRARRALRLVNGEPDPWRRWLSHWWPVILFEIFAFALIIGVLVYSGR